MDRTEEIIERIVSSVHNSYTKNEKMRYVYLELGKELTKNADFFFSLLNKLDDNNLLVSELESIYNSNNLTKGVVCKTCVKALKMIFDRIGIESKIMKTVNKNTVSDDTGTIDIYHYFLCCEGDENKKYFLTLSADLGNIQMGYRTEHFATDIPYELDGSIIYDGDRVDNSIMSLEEIAQIDKKLGYLKDYYFKKKEGEIVPELDYANYGIELLRHSYHKNNSYYTHLEENTHNVFYRTVQLIPCKNGSIVQLNNTSIEEIKKLDLTEWKNNILSLINIKIMGELGDSISQNVKDELLDLVLNNRIDEWINLMLKEVNQLDLSKLDTSHNFEPVVLIKKMEKLFNDIEEENVNSSSVRKLIANISYQFIEPELVLSKDKNDYVSNYYIASKFEYEMPRVLELGTKTDFSQLGYSEQTETISDLLESIFPEINIRNSGRIKTYDNNISAVKNRIITSGVKNRKTGEYSFLFHIIGDSDDETFTYLYNPKYNKMVDADLFSIAEDNIIITSKLNPTIDSIEKIDSSSIENSIKK